ncbi:Serine/threonine-protein kinase hal4 [Mycena sanguinolenta]|uniref:Serine/threonine-protein kinase hal4 n=1 Tax=Mycena sanguinolenta TaxID=230812 RepID=A0A8H7DAS1_9AGAR|nr:Serine/threonine-protein kinase hal4 [Mycena sanguinolenta]
MSNTTPTTTSMATSTTSIPLPPPDAAAYEKQPGLTRQDLLDKSKGPVPAAIVTADKGSKAALKVPVSIPASAPTSPIASVAPPASVQRAASASASKPKPSANNSKSAPNTPAVPSRAPSRAASVASEASGDGKHKFTLKDLLGSGPKLSRKGSAKSVSSRHSADSGSEVSFKSGGDKDSYRERGKSGGSVKSAGGDSTASLSKKYGVCEKVAIGKGATSVVRLVHKWDRSEGNKMYAVKEFRKRRKTETEKEYVKKLTAEFCISSTLHHVNIVETVDLVQDEQGRWCEVMEFCPGGDLYAAIKKGGMSPSEVECCFKQILCGVGYLHSQGVAHRDIKPENLFFDLAGHLKIGDYGASTVYRLPWEATIHMSTGLCGSEPYIAPEQFLGKRTSPPRSVPCANAPQPTTHASSTSGRAGSCIIACTSRSCPGARRSSQTSCTPRTPPQPLLHLPPPLIAAPNGAPSSSSATGSSTAPPTPAVDRDRHQTNSSLVFPPTISNLSPRACRPLIRKMLEPDPKKRSGIEEVLGCAWMQGVEVCWEVGAGGKACACECACDGSERVKGATIFTYIAY